MAARAYDNFDLLIEAVDAEHYRVRVTACPAGDAPAQLFALPFSERELADLLDNINPARPRTRRVLDRHEEACANLGGGLFDAVFRDEIRTLWRRSLDDTRDRHAGLRLRLRLGDAPTLAALPWEFLYDRPGRRYFAQSDRTPIVRYLDVTEPPRPLLVAGPLRILVVISDPIGLPALDAEAEWAKIADVLADRVSAGSVILQRLPKPTLGVLQSWLRHNEVNVLHFVGHGEYDRRREEGYLAFCDSTRHVVQVTSAMLGTHVRDHDPLRLVVLNACQSATNDSVDIYGGVAQGLVQQEAAAVVAMQYPITDQAAIAFTGGFYGALTDGEPVDQAITSVRKTLLEDHPEEWATPVLFLRTADGRVFEQAQPPAPSDGPVIDPDRDPVTEPSPVHDPSPVDPAPELSPIYVVPEPHAVVPATGSMGDPADRRRRPNRRSVAAAAVLCTAATVGVIVALSHHGSNTPTGGRASSSTSATDSISLSGSTGPVTTPTQNGGGQARPRSFKTNDFPAPTYTGPSRTAFRPVTTLRAKSTVVVWCTLYGAPALKGNDRLWYWTSDHGWINDLYVHTGHSNPQQPQCAGNIDRPSVGSRLPSRTFGPFTVVLGQARSAPVYDAVAGAEKGQVTAGQLVTIACSKTGRSPVHASSGGTTSTKWDKLASGDWVPDAYLLTGGLSARTCGSTGTSHPQTTSPTTTSTVPTTTSPPTTSTGPPTSPLTPFNS